MASRDANAALKRPAVAASQSCPAGSRRAWLSNCFGASQRWLSATAHESAWAHLRLSLAIRKSWRQFPYGFRMDPNRLLGALLAR
jgi:hypothetical protein